MCCRQKRESSGCWIAPATPTSIHGTHCSSTYRTYAKGYRCSRHWHHRSLPGVTQLTTCLQIPLLFRLYKSCQAADKSASGARVKCKLTTVDCGFGNSIIIALELSCPKPHENLIDGHCKTILTTREALALDSPVHSLLEYLAMWEVA